jgi:Zn-dependent protease
MGILRFRLFGFPVAVLPGYWLLSALMAFGVATQSLVAGLQLLGVMFCSILVHELGHAFMARVFGLPAQITLHMMGGATAFPGSLQLSRRRDVMISLAGPFAGLLLGVVAAGVLQWQAPGALLDTSDENAPAWVAVLRSVVLINFLWSALNLMPVIPFDGGRVLEAALGPTRREVAGTISLVVGLLLAVWLLKVGAIFGAVLFAAAAISSFLRLRQPAEPATAVDEAALGQVFQAAERALEREQFQQASQLAHQVLSATRVPALGQKALSTLLWARLGLGDVQGARGLMLSAPANAVDRYLAAAVHEAFGELDDARRILSEARAQGDERVQVTALLVKVLLGQGKFAAAANLTREIVERIAPDEARRVVTEARHGGASAEAAHLSLALARTQRNFADAIDAIFGFAVAGLTAEAKTAFGLALEYDAEAARRLLEDERLRALRTDLEPLIASR